MYVDNFKHATKVEMSSFYWLNSTNTNFKYETTIDSYQFLILKVSCRRLLCSCNNKVGKNFTFLYFQNSGIKSHCK